LNHRMTSVSITERRCLPPCMRAARHKQVNSQYSSLPNFALTVIYCHTCETKNLHNTVVFDQIINCWGLLYPPLHQSWPNLMCCIPMVYAYMPNSMLTCQISSRTVYYVAIEGRQTQIWPYFQLHHSVVAPSRGTKAR